MRVLVSGCFDVLHAGHIEFLESAAKLGELTVSVGSDETIRDIKGRWPMLTQAERINVISALRCVTNAVPSPAEGVMDFLPLLDGADIFIVNEDGASEEKRMECLRADTKYIIMKRAPAEGMPQQSSSMMRRRAYPYRISLAGGWIDQPWVSSICPGSMVVACIEPTIDFDGRSGMATSTRSRIADVWGDVPPKSSAKMARILFSVDNPPGTERVSGSQDAIGLCYPGISRLDYAGSYWPSLIASETGDDVLEWFERVIHLVPLGPRERDFDPLAGMRLSAKHVGRLGSFGAHCWRSILNKSIIGLGESLSGTLECYREMFPASVEASYPYRHCLPTGAGGGGYLVVASEDEVPGSLSIRVRRKGSA